MKDIFLVLCILCLLGSVGTSLGADRKTAAHRVVFEFVSDNPKHFESILNNVENLIKALGKDTEVIVVAHGGGLTLLHKPDAATQDRMEKISSKNVTFAACENTMKRKNVEKKDLVSFAITVDSGVAEVVRRQESGWTYVKSH